MPSALDRVLHGANEDRLLLATDGSICFDRAGSFVVLGPSPSVDHLAIIIAARFAELLPSSLIRHIGGRARPFDLVFTILFLNWFDLHFFHRRCKIVGAQGLPI